jgi:hypothetical protein
MDPWHALVADDKCFLGMVFFHECFEGGTKESREIRNISRQTFIKHFLFEIVPDVRLE